MPCQIETSCEPSGEWTATVPSLPGLKAYGASKEEALAKAQELRAILAAEDRPHRFQPHRILAFYLSLAPPRASPPPPASRVTYKRLDPLTVSATTPRERK